MDVDGGVEHWTLPAGGATGLLSLNAAAAAKAGRQRPTNNALLCVLDRLRKIRPHHSIGTACVSVAISPERPAASSSAQHAIRKITVIKEI